MITDEDAQKVRLVLASSGWNDVMQPALANRGRQAVKALVMSRAERAAHFKGTDFEADDDVLRAIIRDCEWMVYAWVNELATNEANRRNEELARQQHVDTYGPPNE